MIMEVCLTLLSSCVTVMTAGLFKVSVKSARWSVYGLAEYHNHVFCYQCKRSELCGDSSLQS